MNFILSTYETLIQKEFDSSIFLLLLSNTVDIFTCTKIEKDEKKMIKQRLCSVIVELNFEPKKSSSIILSFGKTMQSYMKHFKRELKKRFFEKYLLDKYLILVDFILDENEVFYNFDAFLNITYALLTKSGLSDDVRFTICSYIMRKGGFNFFMELIKIYG